MLQFWSTISAALRSLTASKVLNCKGFQSALGSAATSTPLLLLGQISLGVWVAAITAAVVAALICLGYELKVEHNHGVSDQQ